MSRPFDRRGILRGLVTLPLIGGSVTLIGAPSAVAEPASRYLLAEYVEWLGHERNRAAAELTRSDGWADFHRWTGPAFDWQQADVRAGILPSSRAAIVLSAVGVDWRRL